MKYSQGQQVTARTPNGRLAGTVFEARNSDAGEILTVRAADTGQLVMVFADACGSEIAAPPIRSLRDYRHRNNLSLDQMAQRVGCTAAALSRIETGKRAARKDLARRIVAATEGVVDFNALFGPSDKSAMA